MSETIRILLADDHAVVREGLRALLEQQTDLLIVGEASDGAAALRLLASEPADVVVLDMKMPGAGAVDTIQAIKQQRPRTQVLVFTSYAEDGQVRDALSAGATGYLLKDAMAEDLIRAIREVHAGRAWLHPQAQRQMLEWMRRPPSQLDSLTSRERSVLALLADGQSNKQIARNLGLTAGTVKGYVSQVLEKLGVSDRTQAALLAQKEGIAPE
jgi:DNA-binding NarL/FixJ family response regulator